MARKHYRSPSKDTIVLSLRAPCTSTLDADGALVIVWHRDMVIFSATKNDPSSCGEFKCMSNQPCPNEGTLGPGQSEK